MRLVERRHGHAGGESEPVGFTSSKFKCLMGTGASRSTPGAELMNDLHDASTTINENHVDGIRHESGVHRGTGAEQ